MTHEQYWYGDATLTDAYLEADRLRIERANYMAWLQGQYVYHAIGSFTECFMSFGKKGKITIKPYVKKPFNLVNKRESDEEREAREERETIERRQRIRNKLMASVMKGGSAHGGNG